MLELIDPVAGNRPSAVGKAGAEYRLVSEHAGLAGQVWGLSTHQGSKPVPIAHRMTLVAANPTALSAQPRIEPVTMTLGDLADVSESAQEQRLPVSSAEQAKVRNHVVLLLFEKGAEAREAWWQGRGG